MSSPTLDPDAIAALFASAADGDVPDERASDKRAAPTVRPVDFRRPRQFNNDVQRRLRRALDAFCRTASSRLSGELRSAIDFEVINVEQLNWADAHGQIPVSSLTAVLHADPIDTRLLLSAEQALLGSAIERLLGGSGESPPPQRRMSDIDTMLARQVFDALTEQLSIVWEELAGGTLSVASLASPQQSAQLASTSEPTLAFTFEAKLLKASMALTLLLPYRAIAPVIDQIGAGEGYGPSVDPEAMDAMDRGIREIDMELRAEVGAADMEILEILDLAPGDLILLNHPADAGVTLYVDGTPIERARPGRNGARRAVQILHRGGLR